MDDNICLIDKYFYSKSFGTYDYQPTYIRGFAVGSEFASTDDEDDLESLGSDYEYVEGLGDLDECNGMTFKGSYGYYVTDGYPYILNCFKGTINSSFQK